MKRLAVLLGVFGLLVVLVLAARVRDGQSFTVDVSEARRAELSETILASGNIEFEGQVQLRSEITARVSAVLVDEGDEVAAGALLIQLDRDALESDLKRAEASVGSARIEIDRRLAIAADLDRQVQLHEGLVARELVGRDAYRQLLNRHEIAQIEVDSARQSLRQTLALRDIAQDQLARTEIRAPIRGRIVSVDVKPGETVIAGTTNIIGSDLMSIADDSVMLAELRVDEADIGSIRVGQAVAVFASAEPHRPVSGEVIHIGSSARRLGASEGLAFRVRVRLGDGIGTMYPGMSCRAEIVSSREDNVLQVPVAAIQQVTGESFVWTVDLEGRARRSPVHTGMANDLSQAILRGVSEGQRVVVGPGRTLARLTEGARLDFGGVAE